MHRSVGTVVPLYAFIELIDRCPIERRSFCYVMNKAEVRCEARKVPISPSSLVHMHPFHSDTRVRLWRTVISGKQNLWIADCAYAQLPLPADPPSPLILIGNVNAMQAAKCADPNRCSCYSSDQQRLSSTLNRFADGQWAVGQPIPAYYSAVALLMIEREWNVRDRWLSSHNECAGKDRRYRGHPSTC